MLLSNFTEALFHLKNIGKVLKEQDSDLSESFNDLVGWMESNSQKLITEIVESGKDQPWQPLLYLEDIPEEVKVLVATGGIKVKVLENTLTYTGYRSYEDAENDRNPIEFNNNKVQPGLPPLSYVQLQEVYDIPLQEAVANGEIEVYIPAQDGDFQQLVPGGLYDVIHE